MELSNVYIDELKVVRAIFDLEFILSFQLEHDVQIIRQEDFQYHCFIDGLGSFSQSLTPLHALATGIKRFAEHECNEDGMVFQIDGKMHRYKDRESAIEFYNKCFNDGTHVQMGSVACSICGDSAQEKFARNKRNF